MNKKQMAGFGIGLASGAVIGGVVALLYAPKTGKATRQMIRGKAINTFEAGKARTTQAANILRETAAQTLQRGNDGRVAAETPGSAEKFKLTK